MKMVLLFFALLSLAASFTIIEPAEYAGMTFPLVLFRQQWNNVDWTPFNNTYKVGNMDQGCRGYCNDQELIDSGVNVSGTVACISEESPTLGNCGWWQIAQTLERAGAVAIWYSSGPEASMNFLPGTPTRIPMFWPYAWYPDYLAYLPTFGEANVTVRLSFPQQNPLMIEQSMLGGGIAVIRGIGIALGVLIIILSVFRWTQFYSLQQERFSLNLPIVILAINVVSGGFVLFNAITLNFQGGLAVGENLLRPVADFFELWCWQFCATQVLLLGFYFGEVSRISTSQGMPLLDKFKIPAIIVLALLWIFTIVISGISSVETSISGSASEASMAIFTICWVAASAILLWGALSLAAGMSNLTSGKGSMLKIIVSAVFLVLILLGCGLAYLSFRMYTLVLGEQLDVIGITALNQFLLGLQIFAPAAMSLFFILIFRVETQKEIEMSKSGTSSTSSGSKSSSSSSSASNDPVIEL